MVFGAEVEVAVDSGVVVEVEGSEVEGDSGGGNPSVTVFRNECLENIKDNFCNDIHCIYHVDGRLYLTFVCWLCVQVTCHLSMLLHWIKCINKWIIINI